ncbi:unnamed protein product [Schistosoma mattheei]|uniref:Uncharacterized protein n=1 Tax=Schistosoma mattheei TaxID=31246 RepID=A0A3P8GP86_9TREM|nr:unnamed protein product [Schistosoma mattheei]
MPINIQDHGDHWKRINDLAEQTNPSITMHQPTLRRSSEVIKKLYNLFTKHLLKILLIETLFYTINK